MGAQRQRPASFSPPLSSRLLLFAKQLLTTWILAVGNGMGSMYVGGQVTALKGLAFYLGRQSSHSPTKEQATGNST